MTKKELIKLLNSGNSLTKASLDLNGKKNKWSNIYRRRL